MKKSNKTKLATFLLAFFLGAFGIHRFYVGKTGTGIAQLLLTLSFFGMIITSFWVIYDWIMILTNNFTDGEGKKITEWEIK